METSHSQPGIRPGNEGASFDCGLQCDGDERRLGLVGGFVRVFSSRKLEEQKAADRTGSDCGGERLCQSRAAIVDGHDSCDVSKDNFKRAKGTFSRQRGRSMTMCRLGHTRLVGDKMGTELPAVPSSSLESEDGSGVETQDSRWSGKSSQGDACLTDPWMSGRARYL